MDTNKYNNRSDDYDEINLQELFMALWRQKVLIVVITLIAALFTGLFSVFAIKPVYHSRLNIIINVPESYNTKYGDYLLPLTTNEQYINLITSNDIMKNTIEDMGYSMDEVSIESIRERITIEQTNNKSDNQNSFFVKVSSDNPQEAKKLASVLYDNYIKFLDIMITEGATKYFLNYYSVQLQSLQVEYETNQVLLERNYVLLEETPKTINQKEVMDQLDSSDNHSEYIIMGNIINPNYTELELDIIETKQTINSLQNSIYLYNEYINELNSKMSAVREYYETGNYDEFQGEVINIIKSNIYLPSDPITPSRKSSPSISRNVIIGGLLGGVIAVLIALIKEYWFKKEVK